ncbi:MAG: dienelactone hydrolase family protein [bacterium]|nr:dienelactone hydrolase family protein [bacterium]
MKFINILSISALSLFACNQTAKKTEEAVKIGVKNENIAYSLDTIKMNGYIAYDSVSQAKRPVVLVIHEWWGQNNYVKDRANQLAELGYLAMAVDLYGNGDMADNPEQAGQMAGPFYQNPQMAKNRFDAALALIKSNPLADTNKIAAIGYCFGGGMILNIARLGENLKGVVSFHGSLVGVPANKELLKANVLVCHGEADQFVKAEEVAKFRRDMDSIGAIYTFKSYPNATHAFSNPDATEVGKKFSMPIAYNAQADTASWNEMKVFFGTIFK